MPFDPGERIDWIPIRGNPETAIFRLDGINTPLTVANGGLIARRKGALHAVFTAPADPGKYAYEFESDGEIVARGHVRVRNRRRRRDRNAPAAPSAPEPRGVRARRAGES